MTADFGDRSTRLALCFDWLDIVKREHELPDLWASVAQEAGVIVGEVVDEERRFTPDEQRRLAERLREVEAFLEKVHPLTPEQATWLHDRIEYAAEATTRLTVKDWKLLFGGLTIQVVGSLAVNGPLIHELFSFIGRNIMPVLGTMRGLLLP